MKKKRMRTPGMVGEGSCTQGTVGEGSLRETWTQSPWKPLEVRRHASASSMASRLALIG